VSVSDVADHVDRAVQVAGPLHVGLGSDWDGTDRLPRGLESAELLPNLTAELMARGYGRQDLQAILGGNYLRAFRQIFGA
jgi:membrane dipeptidase